MAVSPTLSAGWLACLSFAITSPALILTGSPTRIDLLNPRGNRTGSGRIEPGRQGDFFDTQGNRTGYAVIEGDGVDFFDVRSNRMGFGRTRDGEVETFGRQGSRARMSQWPAGSGR